jgi:hypothetical protein
MSDNKPPADPAPSVPAKPAPQPKPTLPPPDPKIVEIAYRSRDDIHTPGVKPEKRD